MRNAVVDASRPVVTNNKSRVVRADGSAVVSTVMHSLNCAHVCLHVRKGSVPARVCSIV